MGHRLSPKQRLFAAFLLLLLSCLLQSSVASSSCHSPLSFVQPAVSRSRKQQNQLIWRKLRGGDQVSTTGTPTTPSTSTSSATTTTTVVSPTTSRVLNYNATSADPGSWSSDVLFQTLETNIEQGLSEDQVQTHLDQFECNSFQPPAKASLLEFILEQF
jgi:hypothetical protein